MARAVRLLFKRLTKTEFARINSGGYEGGGGQAYIDFPLSLVSLDSWDDFFGGAAIKSQRAQGPAWTFDVRSLGVDEGQTGIVAYQRGPSRAVIGSQKLPERSGGGRRLLAWRPEKTGFPASEPINNAGDVPEGLIDNLRVFLIRDDTGTIWAGWTQQPGAGDLAIAELNTMFAQEAGLIDLGEGFEIDTANPNWPFLVSATSEGPSWHSDDEIDEPEVGLTYSLQKIRNRDKAAAESVRRLYTNCQISGDEFVFLTASGKPYLEVHHVIPLGKGGADSPHNMIVISAQMHKMLHHALVSEIDLSAIVDHQLPITINGKAYTISWHPQHAAKVLAHNPP